MFEPSNETHFFVLRRGKCHHLTNEEIYNIVAAGADGLLLVCDTAIDSSGYLRTVSDLERGLLSADSAHVRVTSNADHPECKIGEVFLGHYTKSEIDDGGSIGWTSKRVGRFSRGNDGKLLPLHLPVFARQDEIFPGSYPPKG
jgi:hypothetical protein